MKKNLSHNSNQSTTIWLNSFDEWAIQFSTSLNQQFDDDNPERESRLIPKNRQFMRFFDDF